jgi:hypothetical protein
LNEILYKKLNRLYPVFPSVKRPIPAMHFYLLVLLLLHLSIISFDAVEPCFGILCFLGSLYTWTYEQAHVSGSNTLCISFMLCVLVASS